MLGVLADCTQQVAVRVQILYFRQSLQLAVVLERGVRLKQPQVGLVVEAGVAQIKLVRLELLVKVTLVVAPLLMVEITLRLAVAVLVQ